MKYREFGKTGIEVTEVGLGTWQFGGDWGEVTDESALRILEIAWEHGVRFFDTADVYGSGRSELLLGRFLKQLKEKAFVATKFGRFPDPGGEANWTREIVRSHVEGSLKRLGVEVLDLEQLHCLPFDLMRKGEVFEWMRELQKEGKIRAFGASVETIEEGLLCLEQQGLASLQIIFNIFRQRPAEDLLPRCRTKRVAVIARLPLASGLLAGKFEKGKVFAPQDHRNYNRDGQAFNVGETFAGIPFEKGVELAEHIRPLVFAGMTPAQMAIRWCLDFDAVTVVIPGATKPGQASVNAEASGITSLPPIVHRKLREFYETEVLPNIRGKY
jgi:aryl-alcohol dehydrogenase-like predicted oxidoreductase